jgi:outer membrane protein OmpA-like peptidoglycan-associated protein
VSPENGRANSSAIKKNATYKVLASLKQRGQPSEQVVAVAAEENQSGHRDGRGSFRLRCIVACDQTKGKEPKMIRLKAKSALSLLALGCLCGESPAIAQTSSDKVEINIFGGTSYWGAKNAKTYAGNTINMKLDEGGILGFRVTENLFQYIGIEESVTAYGTNNVNLRSVPGVYGNTVSFGARARQFSIGPVIYFTPPESRFRPFVQTGGGFNYFYPTDDAKNAARSLSNPLFGNNPLFGPVTGPVTLGSSWKGALNMGVFVWEYGTGFKLKFTNRFGMRVDLRGNMIQTPTFNLSHSNVPSYLSIKEGGPINGLQATAGVSWYLGKVEPPPAHTLSAGEISADRTRLCPGDSVVLKIPVTNSYSDATIKYNWTAGNEAPGSSSDYTFHAPENGGDYVVKVHIAEDPSTVKDKLELRGLKKFGPVAAMDRSITIHVDPYRPPTLACSANPSAFKLGDTSALHATVTSSACNGNLSYSWSASEGSVSRGNSDATYNSSEVRVNPGESKPVTATATVTDAKTRSASCSVNLTVSAAAAPPPPQPAAPKAQQLDDIIFAENDARVNNCGKRTLERLYQQMASEPDATIVLIGHQDASEQSATRRGNAPQYDRQRVENTAAVLSAGGGACQRLELSRIQVDWTGNDQADDFETALCESSVQERAKSKVSDQDTRAKNRRVEVWIVPKGTQMPAGAKSIKPVPESVKTLGCPK